MRSTIAALTIASALFAVPALADNAEGTIKSIDQDKGTVTLTNGQVYQLPGEFDYSSIASGMKVLITYEKSGKDRYISGIDPADQ